ncbi:MAG: glycosyltransferase [Candidatus Thiodiazotropha sp. (ex Dulcina madagascariensis)]|nr:glycosyltransferase [Candidatus Thiodiazotropha sp. (ex Dulcina madagascariensis)]
MDALSGSDGKKARLLFWGEDLALSHVVRPLVLADAVRDKYEIIFVTGERYAHLVEGYGLTPRRTWTLSTDTFMERLSKGRDGWLAEEISRQVKDELALIEELSPDLIIGDLRWSLGTSAELTKTPYVSLVDAYWGPYCTLPPPTPEFPFVRVLGVKLSSLLMPLLAPAIFKQLAKPFNAVRREYGLKELAEYREVATHADWVAYPDLPALAPTADPPDNHRYLGPVQWSPTSQHPPWWDRLPSDKPLIYVAMGSTGRVGVVDSLIEVLGEMPVTVMLSTSGRLSDKDYPANFYTTDYLPGMEACERSALVICNGGAGTVYQAIAGETPILGIPTNADQYYVIDALTRQGAGLYIRSTHDSQRAISAAMERLLTERRFIARIGELNRELSQFNAADRFADVIESAL